MDGWQQRDHEELLAAFLSFADPLTRDAGPSAEELRDGLERAQLVWNLPILHALPTELGTDGAKVRAAVARRLVDLPRFRVRSSARSSGRGPRNSGTSGDPSSRWTFKKTTRATRRSGSAFGQAGRARSPGRCWAWATMAGPRSPTRCWSWRAPYERCCGAATGRSRPGKRSIWRWSRGTCTPPSNHGGDTRASCARRRSRAPGARRRSSRRCARQFEGMVAARRTRFSYDPRVIAATSVRVDDGILLVDAAAFHFE